MTSRDIARSLRAAAFLSLAAFVACDDSNGAKVKVGPISVVNIVSGDLQSDTVGQQLPSPLSVEVKDSAGHAIAQQVVNFVVVKGGGSVFAGAASTNAEGKAQELWTLGT